MLQISLIGLSVLLVLVPIGCLAWLAMLGVMFRMLGVEPRALLDEITLAEAVLVAGLGFGAAYLVAALFSCVQFIL